MKTYVLYSYNGGGGTNWFKNSHVM